MASSSAGESRTVTPEVPVPDVAHWDEISGGWVVEPTTYAVWVGSSSEELPLGAELTVVGP